MERRYDFRNQISRTRKGGGPEYTKGVQGSQPRSLKPEELIEFRDSLMRGDSLGLACGKIHISDSVMRRWKKDYPEFREIIEAYHIAKKNKTPYSLVK